MVITVSQAPTWARGFKLCSKCDTVKGLREYQRNRSRKDGRQSQCRPCQNENSLKWAHANTEYRKLSGQLYHAANREHRNAQAKAWAKSNRTRKAETDFVNCHKRRARKLDADTDGWTRADVLRVAEESDTYGCIWCGGDAGEWQADHIYPLSRGGVDRLENIGISCQPCNSEKYNRLPYSEWEPPLDGR